MAALAGSGCSGGTPDEGWVARVGDRHLSAARFEAEVTRALARYERNDSPVPPEVEQALRAHVRERMIEDEILHQQATALELRVADADLDAAVAADKARFRSEAAYSAHIQETYGDAARARAALRRRLLIEHAIGVLGKDLEPGPETHGCEGTADMPAAEVTATASCRAAERRRAVRQRRAVLAAVAPSMDIERRDPATAPSPATQAVR